MSKVAIVTDSNSGITQAEGKELDIFVVPMPFYINGKLYYEEKCKEWEVTKEVVDKFIMKERMSQEDGSN